MDYALLAGNDSGLTNAWDELCVQLQGELSIFWDHYEQVVRDLVQGEIRSLPAHEIDAIWLQTPSGENWSCEEEDARDPDPVVDDEVTEHIAKDFIYPRASDWSNRRIRKYLERAE